MSNKILSWQPTCNLEALQQRAKLLQSIREFFAAKQVMEVETPTLSTTTIPDPHIASLTTAIFDQVYYLQTSPEFHMKRLLAAGSGSIYQICKAFRADEIGRFHNPEFTMLEWYRVDFNAEQLLAEIDAFLILLLNAKPAKYYSYQALFQNFLGIDPLVATAEELQHTATINQIIIQGLDLQNKDAWLNLLMSHCIEPKLNETNQPYFIYDFPLSQAALAKQSAKDARVAERFEVYMHGIELANGFHELTDAIEQRQRFEDYLSQREKLNLANLPMPESFLAALQHGLPACSGVALGIDRLLMIANHTNTIQQVIAFPTNIA